VFMVLRCKYYSNACLFNITILNLTAAYMLIVCIIAMLRDYVKDIIILIHSMSLLECMDTYIVDNVIRVLKCMNTI
jgi:hypothetical protein